jgi:SH3-like domain-containing protein
MRVLNASLLLELITSWAAAETVKEKRGPMSFVRIAASAAIVTLLSAVGATAKPIVTTADTNLRKAAGTSSEVLTLIPKGTTVEVGTCTNGWCQASLNGQDGFVIGQNVGMASARRAPPRRTVMADDEVDDEVGPPVYYGPRPYGPPLYYGYGPFYGGFYGGWGWVYRGGWGRRW